MIIKLILIIELITFLAIYICNRILINYSMKLLNVKNSSLVKIFPICMSIISYILICKNIYTPLAYVLIFFLYVSIFKGIFYNPIEEIIIIIMCYIFNMILYRDVSIGILSILTRKSMYEAIHSYWIYVLSFGICRFFIYILFIKINKSHYIEIAKKLLINRKRLIMGYLTIGALIIILLNTNYTYFYIQTTVNNSRNIYLMLINRIGIGFCFIFSIEMGIKSIKWVEEEIFYKSNLLNLEHNDKINKKIDEYSNLLRMYNHDFKNILLNIKDSIDIGDIEKAKQIISEFDSNINNIMDYNKRLSNNSLINALLNRVYEECNLINIRFDADCYISSNINITELELINVFNNLSSNAVEACTKQNNTEEKWISFKSYIKDNNLIIYQSNSFNGHIKFRKDRLITTKKEKALHGIGVESIKHIVDKANGIALIKVDKENREFKFLIKIPLIIKCKNINNFV